MIIDLLVGICHHRANHHTKVPEVTSINCMSEEINIVIEAHPKKAIDTRERSVQSNKLHVDLIF